MSGMHLRSVSASIAGLMLVTMIGAGCAEKKETAAMATRAEQAASRAEDAARRAESVRSAACALSTRTCPWVLIRSSISKRILEKTVSLEYLPFGTEHMVTGTITRWPADAGDRPLNIWPPAPKLSMLRFRLA